MARENVLYRFYADDDALLYIGISITPWERFRQHRADKPWWEDIARVTMERHPSRDAVLLAERDAIHAEHPRHNVVHNGRHEKSPRPVRQATPSPAPSRRIPHYTVVSKYGNERTGPLWLEPEPNFTAMSCDYSWDDLDPHELFLRWHRVVERKYPDDFIPIYWSVRGSGIFERTYLGELPGDGTTDGPHFLDYYDLPLDEQGREVWMHQLPVAKLRWSAAGEDNAGFLTLATGWKPNPLQPDVSLRMLRILAHGKSWDMARDGRSWELVR